MVSITSSVNVMFSVICNLSVIIIVIIKFVCITVIKTSVTKSNEHTKHNMERNKSSNQWTTNGL